MHIQDRQEYTVLMMQVKLHARMLCDAAGTRVFTLHHQQAAFRQWNIPACTDVYKSPLHMGQPAFCWTRFQASMHVP